MKNTTFTLLAFCTLLLLSCQKEENGLETTEQNFQKNELALSFDVPMKASISNDKSQLENGVINEIELPSDQITAINKELKKKGIALLKIEAMSENSPILLFDKQLDVVRNSSSWVANDPRRGGTTNLTYNLFQNFSLANQSIPTGAITDDAFNRWENEANCGGATIIKNENPGIFNSAILTINGVSGNPYSDINILGHIPSFVFGLVGLSNNTLGVAFTFIFVDEEGVPTDIDNDDKADTSLKEVWYNDGYTWTDDPITNPDAIDLASVITHEIGHTLEAGHFGNGVFNSKQGTISYSPRAVMNALYFEAKSDLQNTDRASYCNTFSNW